MGDVTGAVRRRRLAAARLYVVAPARIRAGRLSDLIPALAVAGVDIVQIRDRTLPPDALRREAAACAEAARHAGVLFVVNDDPALAADVGADGVHIGQDDGTVAAARARLGPDRLVGRSTRGRAALSAAAAEGADYASVGPVRETPTKAGRAATGTGPIAAAAREAGLPWFAIGGIDDRTVLRVGALGARRVAVVRAVTEVLDPAAAVRRLRARLGSAVPRVLTVAGSDSGGGAGVQADLRAVAARGGHATCAVTAVTAQSTVGVRAWEPVTPSLVGAQVRAVLEDIGADAVKTGMLAGAPQVEAVAAALDDGLDPRDEVPLVVDPVLAADADGAALLRRGGLAALRRLLLPRATVVTPNIAEARALLGRDGGGAPELARALQHRYGCAALVTGGHSDGVDALCAADGTFTAVPGPHLDRGTTHGVGCTHSATLAVLLGAGVPLPAAAACARATAARAVAAGRTFGAGPGLVDVLAGVGAPLSGAGAA